MSPSSAQRARGTPARTASGISPTSSAPSTGAVRRSASPPGRPPRRRAARARSGRGRGGCTTPGPGDPTASPSARTSGRRTSGATAPGRVGRGDPHVVGHEHAVAPRPRSPRCAGRPGPGRSREQAEIRRGEGVPADLGQRPAPAAGKGPVAKGRHAQFVAEPAGELVAQRRGAGQVVGGAAARGVGDEGHDVEHPEAGMDAVVAAEVEARDGGGGQRAGRRRRRRSARRPG